MATEDFTRIILWQKAQELAADASRSIAALPKTQSARVIGDQLLRSAGSVPANIAEGYGRFSQAAYRSHLSIARGSLFETQSWIHLLNRTGDLSDEKKAALLEQCQQIGKILTQRMKSLGAAKLSYAREERLGYVTE